MLWCLKQILISSVWQIYCSKHGLTWAQLSSIVKATPVKPSLCTHFLATFLQMLYSAGKNPPAFMPPSPDVKMLLAVTYKLLNWFQAMIFLSSVWELHRNQTRLRDLCLPPWQACLSHLHVYYAHSKVLGMSRYVSQHGSWVEIKLINQPCLVLLFGTMQYIGEYEAWRHFSVIDRSTAKESYSHCCCWYIPVYQFVGSPPSVLKVEVFAEDRSLTEWCLHVSVSPRNQ